MDTRIDTKRIGIFLLIAFGVAWATGLVIYLTGGLAHSPVVAGPFTLALILLATTYMGAPALAHVLTRLLTREGWHPAYLQPKLRRGWRYWLLCWFAPGVLTILGAALYFALFPQTFDPALNTLRRLMSSAAPGQTITDATLWTVIAAQIGTAFFLAPLLNAIPTLGEEFGWRAYLLRKLMPLGGRRAMALLGVIWGVWHWPVIFMGYNYGLDYPGAPVLGPLMMVWFTLVFGTFIGWATLRAGSVWPAVIGHGALNGIAGVSGLVLKGQPNLLLGPTPLGLIGSLGFTLIALYLFVRPGALELPAPSPDSVSIGGPL